MNRAAAAPRERRCDRSPAELVDDLTQAGRRLPRCASNALYRQPTLPDLGLNSHLCLLVYKLAEVRVHQRLAATGQTVPHQVRKPTARPTMRWLCQCFEGIDLHHTVLPDGSRWTE